MDYDYIRPYLRFVSAFKYNPHRIVTVAGYDCRLYFIRDGRCDICYEDTKATLTKNTMIYIPSGVFYRFENFEKMIELFSFNFDITKNDGFPKSSVFPAEEQLFDPSAIYEKNKSFEFSHPVFIKDASAFHDRLFEIVREFTVCEDGFREKSQALFTAVLITLLRYVGSDMRKEERLVNEVRAYLNDHLADEFRAGNLVNNFHYHPNYVNRIFKETTGVTIHNFLLERRIEVAKQLLVSSSLTVEEIALQVGFKTHPHFSQAFRMRVGISPKEYRLANERIVL